MPYNSQSVAVVLAMSCALLPLIASGSGPTIPAVSILSDAPNYSGQEIHVSGILGFTDACGYALYASHYDAVFRDSERAIALSNFSKSSITIDQQLVEDDLIGRYVLVAGKLVTPVKALKRQDLVVRSLFHSYGASLPSASCAKNGKDRKEVVKLQDALSNARARKFGKEVSVIGVLGTTALGLALYTDADAAQSKVASNVAIIKLGEDEDASSYERLEQSVGKAVVVSGIVECFPLSGVATFSLRDSTVEFW